MLAYDKEEIDLNRISVPCGKAAIVFPLILILNFMISSLFTQRRSYALSQLPFQKRRMLFSPGDQNR